MGDAFRSREICEHMTAHVKLRRPAFLLFLLLMLPGVSAVATQTTYPGTDLELATDLRTVIILSGYPCKSILGFSQPTPSEYHVSCDTDTRYRVRISEQKAVRVDSLSDPSTTKPRDKIDHEKFVRKQLFSIVNLAGHECAGVLSYERSGPRGNLVICEGQVVYRIHVTPEGQIAVEKRPIEK